jgi:AraC-like DNA-binding protein
MKAYKLPESSQFKKFQKSLGIDEHTLVSGELSTPCNIPEHHSNFGLAFMLKGEGKFKFNQQYARATPEKFLMINKGSNFSMEIGKSGTQPVLLYFQKDTPAHVAASLYYSSEKLIEEPSVPYEVDFSLIERLHFATPSILERVKLLNVLSESCSSFYALKSDATVRSILEELLIENASALKESLRLNVVKKSTRVEIVKRLYHAREWIEANYLREITLQDLSNVANLNSQHFLRLFKQLFQKTPHQYIIDLRIEEAKRLLLVSDLPINVICNDVGWESLASFSKMFKQRIGLNPTEFRKSVQHD